LIVAIVVYIASLGRLNVTSHDGAKRKELNDDKEKTRARHRKLLSLIQQKRNLADKLRRRFKLAYFFVRIGLVGIFVVYDVALYRFFKIKTLGEILNWNEAALIVVALSSFVTFGSFANVRGFVDGCKIRLENIVYGKYVDIEDQIDEHKQEDKELKRADAI
jgi:hypothetical protein